MTERPAGALAGIAMILLLVAPAATAGVRHDTVIHRADADTARISAGAWTGRYPVNDGSGATITVSVTAGCQAYCNAADPQAIADFLGGLLHGPELSLLEVQLDTPSEIELDCGYGAQACYYASEDKIVISGSDARAPDGASREFVLAHEYGHHVANHRESPPPFPMPLDWGPAHWASEERICLLRRVREVFPGSFGVHYYRDPGEAFAEAFAHLHFPDSGLRWRWLDALEPDAAAFAAIRRDVLQPWSGRTVLSLSAQVPSSSRGGSVVKAFPTPLDGMVSLRPADRDRYDVRLVGPAGLPLRAAGHGLGLGRPLNFTVCGQSSLRVAIQSSRRGGGPFEVQIQRP